MNAFDYDLGCCSRRDGAGRMANVRKLMRLAREFERNEGRDLAGFLAAAETSTRRDEREGMAPVTAEGHDGVRVMTVHAAKGLQFPVVAVPDLGRGLAAGPPRQRRHDRAGRDGEDRALRHAAGLPVGGLVRALGAARAQHARSRPRPRRAAGSSTSRPRGPRTA